VTGDVSRTPSEQRQGVRILVATKPVDFCKGHDGLAALVQATLAEDPFTGTVFVFRAKRADRMKILFWEPLSQAMDAAVTPRLSSPRPAPALGIKPFHKTENRRPLTAPPDPCLSRDARPRSVRVALVQLVEEVLADHALALEEARQRAALVHLALVPQLGERGLHAVKCRLQRHVGV